MKPTHLLVYSKKQRLGKQAAHHHELIRQTQKVSQRTNDPVSTVKIKAQD